MTNERHFSAFKDQISTLYGFKKGFRFLDLTLGDGGHTEIALDHGCQVVSFDFDKISIDRAANLMSSKYTPHILTSGDNEKDHNSLPWLVINDNFIKVGEYCKTLNLLPFDGIMVDLGPSQPQVLSPEKGMSFLNNEPLDMRLTPDLGVTAADLLSALNEGELAHLFSSLANEPFAKPIARAIVKRRQHQPIKTTQDLVSLVLSVKHKQPRGKIHPATQVFMALRMAVNLERENINLLLPQLPSLVNPGGLIGIISFHQGEDKLIKENFRQGEQQGLFRAITKKPLSPSQLELSISSRTRSAKLRIVQKIS